MKIDPAWWKTAVFYEIYIRSFQDSDGDGVGDLQGVIDRLDYLSWLGVDAIWVTPFYESPQVDLGYDISDHKAIDSRLGTLKIFKALISAAKARNIKVIVDIVLNHTSDQHPFFLESRQSRTSAKRDWYIWRDGHDGGPPNNWEGFERSCWTFDSKTEQYYYHFHLHQQPDLNWRNPDVVREMTSICEFWIDQGAAGLRLDAINYLVEDLALRNNPIVEELPLYLQNIFQFNQLPVHTINHPGNHQLLKTLRQGLTDRCGNAPLLIGEIWVPTPEDLRPFYGDRNDEIHLPFNFFLSIVPALSAEAFRHIIQATEQSLVNRDTTLVLSNHDFPRSIERYALPAQSDAVAKLLATLLFTLRGIPFLYYGEEIGLRDTPPETREDVQDPRGHVRWPEYKGRDGCRTPMPWTDQCPQAGFTTGKPWYKLNRDAAQRNVAVQQADSNSVLSHHKRLIQLRRQTPALFQGSLELLGQNPTVLAYLRSHAGQTV